MVVIDFSSLATTEYVRYPKDIKQNDVLSCNGCRRRINKDFDFGYAVVTTRYLDFKIECSSCWRRRKERA